MISSLPSWSGQGDFARASSGVPIEFVPGGLGGVTSGGLGEVLLGGLRGLVGVAKMGTAEVAFAGLEGVAIAGLGWTRRCAVG